MWCMLMCACNTLTKTGITSIKKKQNKSIEATITKAYHKKFKEKNKNKNPEVY